MVSFTGCLIPLVLLIIALIVEVKTVKKEKILPPIKDAGGPTKFDWSIGPKLMKELQAGLVRFYASSALIVVQHVRNSAPENMADNLETIKIILGRILKGGTSYPRELFELGKSFAAVRSDNIKSRIDTSYVTTTGPSLEIDEEPEAVADNTTSLWKRVQAWASSVMANQFVRDTLG